MSVTEKSMQTPKITPLEKTTTMLNRNVSKFCHYAVGYLSQMVFCYSYISSLEIKELCTNITIF